MISFIPGRFFGDSMLRDATSELTVFALEASYILVETSL
jgi:hypothetical protein